MAYITTEALARQMSYRNVDDPRLQTTVDAASIALDDWCGNHWEPPYPPMIESVCLSLAVDIWKQADATFGIAGLSETGQIRVPRDLVMRYDALLVPYYDSVNGWGVA